MQAGTIVASNYLAMAQVLAESFLEHHPDSHFTVLVVDDGDADLPDGIRVVRLADLDLAPRDERMMRTVYDVMEFSTAVKPSLLRFLLEAGGDEEAACYLDPDIQVFSGFASHVDVALEHGIVLTPHVLHPVPRDGKKVDEETIMQSGMYNCGFLAVGPSARPFLDWWDVRLRFDAVVDFERSRFTDQRWVDWVPSLFDFTIDRDPGMNIAWWNIHDRPIEVESGGPTVEGEPVRFVHFSGYDPQQPGLLSKHQVPRPRLAHDVGTGIRSLSDDYAARLIELGHIERRRHPYPWNRSVDGVELTREVRRVVRDAALDEIDRFGNVQTVPDAFDPSLDFAGWVAGATRTAHVEIESAAIDTSGIEIVRESPVGAPGTDDPAEQPVAYDVDFDWDDAHGHAVRILLDRPERGIVVDIGCGYAPHAEVLRDAGFEFIGLDLDEASVQRLEGRGFTTRRFDLREHERLAAVVDDAIASVSDGSSTPVVGVLALDVLEHLVEPHKLLAALHRWMAPHDGALLVSSVPNVAHRDISAKLLAGRWDVTATGLLDHTHLRFFTDRSITALMESAGFVEAARNDRVAPRSDQRWPTGATITSPQTPLASLVASVRDLGDEHGDTYQLIRGYRASEAPANATLIARDAPTSGRPGVRLSVVADPGFDVDDLELLRRQLQAQSSSDWEMLSVGAPADFADERRASLVALVESVRGSHVAFVARSEEIGVRWVEQFVAAARVTVPGGATDGDISGHVLRCEPARSVDGQYEAMEPERRPGADHPVSAIYAFPTDAVRNVVGSVAGQAHAAVGLFLQLAPLCGVRDTGVPAALPGIRVTDRTWTLDSAVEGSAVSSVLSAANELPSRLEVLEAEVARLRDANETLAQDNRWLNEELAVTPVRLTRRLMRRPASSD